MYRFHPSELTLEAVRRVASEELDRCLDALRDSQAPLDAQVHEARKHLKKLRALLSLIEASTDPEALEFAKRSARLAAHALARLRGRAALLESFDALILRFPNELGPLAIARVREILRDDGLTLDEAVRSLGVAIDLLEHAQRGLPELSVRDASWEILLPGLCRMYARARAAYAKAQEERSPEAFHDFRTPAKRHLYQVELLELVWQETLHARRTKLDKLGDLLGDHHDLALLHNTLSNSPGSEREAERVNVLITRRMQKLESVALRLGGRLFADKAKVFCRRLDRVETA